METLFQMFIPLYIYKYSRHKSHIQSKSLTENMPFFYARKVKLLFGGTQLNKEKKLISLLHLRHTDSFSRFWSAASVLHIKTIQDNNNHISSKDNIPIVIRIPFNSLQF